MELTLNTLKKLQPVEAIQGSTVQNHLIVIEQKKRGFNALLSYKSPKNGKKSKNTPID